MQPTRKSRPATITSTRRAVPPALLPRDVATMLRLGSSSAASVDVFFGAVVLVVVGAGVVGGGDAAGATVATEVSGAVDSVVVGLAVVDVVVGAAVVLAGADAVVAVDWLEAGGAEVTGGVVVADDAGGP